jgi:iron complex outermembrane receptor protein
MNEREGMEKEGPMRMFRLTAGLLLFVAMEAGAQRVVPDSSRDTTRLEAIKVSVARTDSRLTRLPWAVGVLGADDIRRGQATVGIDEALNNIPGVMVSNRYIHALDQRLSIRGAGSRANFGTRGVKVLLDGVPQSLPDGQSQLTNVELGTIGRVEVLRGAASSLYGNGSGGVISFETDMRSPYRLQQEVRTTFGAFGLAKYQLRTIGRTDKVIGSLSLSRMTVDGFRQYSGADVRQLNAAANVATGTSSLLQLRANVAAVPFALNPGALTAAEWAVNPDSAAATNVLRGASRDVQQQQYSANWRSGASDGNNFRIIGYYLTRQTDNPLASPPPPPTVVANGTIVEIRRRFLGARLDAQRLLGGAAAPRINAGVDVQNLRDVRRNARTTNGARLLPGDTIVVHQLETLTSVGPFATLAWSPVPSLETSAGIRWDYQSFEVADRFSGDGDDDSGERTMSAFSGHLGMIYSAVHSFMPYFNLATSFETPTTTELNARFDGTGGFNDDLGPQRIATAEIGARGATGGVGGGGGRFGYDIALFASRTRDAIIQFEEIAGRAYFRNAGRTRSTGAEIGVNAAATSWLDTRLAYTHAHYVFDEYRITRPERTDTLDGNRLAGVPERFVRAGIRTHYRGASIDVDWTWSDFLYADDLNTLRIEDWGRGRFDARAVWSGTVGGQHVSPFIGVNNAFDERYVGSITLNGNGGRVREAAPLRNWYAGFDVQWSIIK